MMKVAIQTDKRNERGTYLGCGVGNNTIHVCRHVPGQDSSYVILLHQGKVANL